MPSEPPRILVVALCGLPGAGKSALASALATSPPLDATVSLIDADAIESAARGTDTWSRETWRSSRMELLSRVAAAISGARDARDARALIIVDDNAWLKSMRRALWVLARDAQCAFCTLWVDACEAEAGARNAARDASARISGDTFARMALAFEPPTASTWESASALRVEAGAIAGGADAVVATARALLAAHGWERSRVPPLPDVQDAIAAALERERLRRDVLAAADAALRAAVAARHAARAADIAELPARKARALAAARALLTGGVFEAAMAWGEDGAASRISSWAEARLDEAIQ